MNYTDKIIQLGNVITTKKIYSTTISHVAILPQLDEYKNMSQSQQQPTKPSSNPTPMPTASRDQVDGSPTPISSDSDSTLISDTSKGSLAKFNKDSIAQHNKLRALHGCPSITLDEGLARDCQKYAEELARAEKMQHSSGDYGENLAYKMASNGVMISGAISSNMWYSEIADYNFNSTADQMKCGHFSQVVWKNTTSAGFGVGFSANKQKVYVVGRYKPAGNFMGQWGQNIPKPLNGKPWIPSKEEM